MMPARKHVLLIILVVLALYSNSFENKFVWDDEFLIVKNPAIMSWNYAWIHFALDLYHSFSNYYRPVQMISYMIDFSFWRLNPFGYHLTNVFLHISVSLCFCMLLQLMTRDRKIAFVGSLLYAAHPAHTAAVTYIAGRADSLAALFMLLSIIFFHWHFKAERNRTALLIYAGSIGFFLLALLSKEVAIILPALILSYRLFFISDEETNKSRAAIKFHYISWFTIVAGAYAVLRLGALNFQEGILLESRYPLYPRFLTSLKALGIYLGIIFLPLHMQMERSIPYVFSFFETGVLMGALLICLVTWLAVRVRKFCANALFGLIFFVISLFPTMNIYPMGSNMAEHWLYVPMMGMFTFTSCLTAKLWNDRKASRPFLAFLMAVYMLFFAHKTFDKNFDWRDEQAIYTHTFNYNPRSIKILNNLGNLYHKKGDFRMAVIFHRKAAEINPLEHKTRLNLGFDYAAMGMPEEALSQYELSARLKPDYAKAYFNMGNVYLEMGNFDMAARAYKQASTHDKLHIGARTNLGNIYFNSGLYEKAISEYKAVIEINPFLPSAHNNLGNAYSELGLYPEVVDEYKKAVDLEPEEAEYHSNLGSAYGNAGMYDEAVYELKEAYMLKPRDARTLINLGAAYFHSDRSELAKKEWQKALIVDPRNFTAKNYLLRTNSQ